MDAFLLNYLPVALFFLLVAGVALVLMVIPWLLVPHKPDPEKVAAYECGFPAFDDSRMKFDVQFYLVAILFIIFDLEIALLVPWALVLGGIADPDIRVFTFTSAMIFLTILTVGLAYEWRKGALEWR